MSEANLRSPQQGQPARLSYRADRANTEVTIQNLLTQGRSVPVTAKQIIQPCIVSVLNNTGSTLTQFSAVGLGAPMCLPTANLDQFQRQVIFNAVVTGATFYGVCLNSIFNGFIGRVAVSGMVQSIGDVPGARVLWTDGADNGYRIVDLNSAFAGPVCFCGDGAPGGPGATVWPPTGAVTDFIKITRAQPSEDGSPTGTVVYDPGTLVDEWPTGQMVLQVSKLPPGTLLIW